MGMERGGKGREGTKEWEGRKLMGKEVRGIRRE